MLPLPSAAEPLFMSLSVAFTQPTFQRILPLIVGAILAMGRRTVTAILWTLRGVIRGHPSTYHRVFSRACWSLWPLGRVLATAGLLHLSVNCSSCSACWAADNSLLVASFISRRDRTGRP